jgi:uncharacterized protein with ATP-grasp and redox domains
LSSNNIKKCTCSLNSVYKHTYIEIYEGSSKAMETAALVKCQKPFQKKKEYSNARAKAR